MKKIIFFGLLFFAVYSIYKADQKKRLRNIVSKKWTSKTEEVAPVAFKVNEVQENFMLRALEISKVSKGADRGARGGSVVVQDGKIIGEGWNNNGMSKDPSAHAAVLSIINACKTLGHCDLAGTDIYATVQPCPTCLSIISTAGIKNVYYCIPRSEIMRSTNAEPADTTAEMLARRRIKREVPEIQVVLHDIGH